jgi:predicted glycosyltransferase
LNVWIDVTNSPHVLVMRPVIEVLRRRGAEVHVTARDFAQTLGLLERFRIDHTAIGRHRGGHVAAKGFGFASRSAALVRWGKGRRIDLALGHGSNDVSVAAALLRIPSATACDYEWARVQHSINCRLAAWVALGAPVWTTFGGRLGAVDKRLIAEGRLRRLTRAEDVVLERRADGVGAPPRVRRDPEAFADLFVNSG